MHKKQNYRLSGLAAIALLFWMAVAFTPAHAQYSVVYNFGSHGGDPAYSSTIPTIVQGIDGFLYTASRDGGAYDRGAVFRMTPWGQMKVLHSFCAQGGLVCPDGSGPMSGLTLGLDGNFYGTTGGGGQAGYGTIYKITPQGDFTVLYSFSAGFQAGPLTPLTLGNDGSLYGVFTYAAIIYRIGPVTGEFTALYTIPTSGTYPDTYPNSPLTLGTDGNFYGATSLGGTNGYGMVFQITPQGNFTVIYNFDYTHGSQPYGPMVEGSDGNFYGTTTYGGTSQRGVVFKLTPTGTLTVLHNFTASDGNGPGGLVQATDGNFYGVLEFGGSNTCGDVNCGILYQITPAGDFSVVYNFDGPTGDNPEGAIPFQHTNGLLYGDTALGGTGSLCPAGRISQCGVFYSWNGDMSPFVSLIRYSGAVGDSVQILGQGFNSDTTVSFNGTPGTVCEKCLTSTYLRAVVPAGATTGLITVTTSSGTLTSNKPFIVTP